MEDHTMPNTQEERMKYTSLKWSAGVEALVANGADLIVLLDKKDLTTAKGKLLHPTR